MNKIVIFGNSSMAAVVAEYIDSTLENKVVAFCVEKEYHNNNIFEGKPLIPFNELENYFNKNEIKLLILTVFGEGFPRVRKKEKSDDAIKKGYTLFSFIDPKAIVAKSAKIGKNCIILNGVIVEPKSIIEDGVFLRSNSYVSHGSRIGEYSYLAPNATVAGQVTVGKFCFLGVNTTVHDRIKIGDFALIGGGSVVAMNIPEYGVVKANLGVLLDKKSTQFNI